ncbi:MAG TPA: metallophosphoesterase [Castellaniella sp.]|uniref:metallophosphoesterase n=1 Tax=Castellaniella sp. TaxID=1955812 RepID=UPI002EFB3297
MGSNLSIVMGAVWLYVIWRFVWPLPIGAGGRVLLALVLFLAAEYHWVTGRYFGTLASPELPQAVLLVLAWAFGAFLLLGMLVLLRDVVGSLVFIVARAPGRVILTGHGVQWFVGALALVLAAVGVWQAVKVPDVKTVNITLPNLPQAFDGYRIVQLTDLHASRLLPQSWQAAVVARADALKPNLIVITGDLADGAPAQRAQDVSPLKNLTAADGVLAIPGNHEYYADYRDWMVAYRALGLHMLENQHVLIQHDGATLAVAGLTDRQAGAFDLPKPDLTAALAGVPPGTTTILLEHRPGDAVQNAQAGIALQLSGHTHGGQIRGPDLLVKRANNGFLSGIYHVGPMVLYVSNGTGLWNGLAIRLGRPSEITQIVLHSGR